LSNYKGKTVIVSGGAEGIGLSVAHAMGKQGMNVVIIDIDAKQLAIGEQYLIAEGIDVLALTMDVIDKSHWQMVVEKSIERFGKIHMLVNNAGVAAASGPIEATNQNDWDWVLDVNLKGVVNGAEAVVPHIKAHGEGGWMINVASMAGMIGVPYAGAYTATKVAVVGMSESWHFELAKHNIHVSVLCPAFVKTRIHLAGRNRQEQYKNERVARDENAPKPHNPAQALVENGIDVDLVGARVVEALNAEELYIFTHPAQRAAVQARFKAIDAAFERAQSSPIVKDVVDQDILTFG
jgi:NAD(P)-dependent dehydrogenase (short-subunit alcohol dehydrogenase family)